MSERVLNETAIGGGGGRNGDAVERATGERRVRVSLGARSYDVVIGSGLIERAGAHVAALVPGAKVAIVTDETVAGHHLAALEGSFSGRAEVRGRFVLPAGEATKSFPELARLTEGLLALGVERGDVVVALGGGVIGDLVGFAAAILRRGVRFVQVPTTLLAQVDSSVGGKTAINTAQGKNLVGAFHQPALVLADTRSLSTLSPREMRAGYAEVVKYGLLGDREFYIWLEQGWRGVVAGNDAAAVTRAVEVSVAAKARIVERDETETGERMLLNLGHTFGHALEAWAGFSGRLLHGEAVAIGMAQAFRFSASLGLAPTEVAARVERHLREVGLPTRIRDIPGPGAPDAAELIALMAQDKKVMAGRLTLILAREIGEAFVTRDVDRAAVETFLQAETA
jgi:3-dehydroquinate synthase